MLSFTAYVNVVEVMRSHETHQPTFTSSSIGNTAFQVMFHKAAHTHALETLNQTAHSSAQFSCHETVSVRL